MLIIVIKRVFTIIDIHWLGPSALHNKSLKCISSSHCSSYTTLEWMPSHCSSMTATAKTSLVKMSKSTSGWWSSDYSSSSLSSWLAPCLVNCYNSANSTSSSSWWRWSYCRCLVYEIMCICHVCHNVPRLSHNPAVDWLGYLVDGGDSSSTTGDGAMRS